MKRRIREVLNITNTNSLFYVRCPKCGKQTFVWLEKEQAIADWNKENPVMESEDEL